MTEEELAQALTDLPGVVTVTSSQENGAPEVSWGDSFFFYDPDNSTPDSRRFPFATIVVNDYPGFDVASNLARPGVFRLNLAVARERFKQLFGFRPADFPAHEDAFDVAVLDHLIPHPVYGKQGWVSVLVPGEHAEDQVRSLIGHAHQRAKDRYKHPGWALLRPHGVEAQVGSSFGTETNPDGLRGITGHKAAT